MVAAFWCLQHHLHPWYFVGFFFLTAVIGAPIWNLVITVALTHLPSPEQQFPKVRLWCTLGWILAGVLCSLVFHADATPLAGYVGAAFRLLLTAFIFILPHTPPRGVTRSWRSLMGFDAFRLLREKDLRVLLIASALLSMPVASFYMHTPEHLMALDDARATFTMSFGQWSEVLAMAITGWLMVKFQIKQLLLVGFGCCVLRFGFFAYAGYEQQVAWMWPGIAIHGICYTLFFIIGQIFMDRRVDPAMRGRVLSLYSMIFNVGPAAGSLILGLVATWAGLRMPLYVAAALSLLIWIWTLRRQPELVRVLEEEPAAAAQAAIDEAKAAGAAHKAAE